MGHHEEVVGSATVFPMAWGLKMVIGRVFLEARSMVGILANSSNWLVWRIIIYLPSASWACESVARKWTYPTSCHGQSVVLVVDYLGDGAH